MDDDREANAHHQPQRCQAQAASWVQDRAPLPSAQWCLPGSRIELIIDYERLGPAIDDSVLHAQQSPPFWTDSAVGNSAFAIRFRDGLVKIEDKSANYFTRCVKGGAEARLPPREPDDHWKLVPGEIADNYTGLTWPRNDIDGTSLQKKTHSDAAQYCSDLTLNNRKWRLPATKELATLIDGQPLGTRISTQENAGAAREHLNSPFVRFLPCCAT